MRLIIIWIGWVLEAGQLTERSKGVDQVPLKVMRAIDFDSWGVGLRKKEYNLEAITDTFIPNAETKFLALDCEMAKFNNDKEPKVASVAIVDDNGAAIFYQLLKLPSDHVFDPQNEFHGTDRDMMNHWSKDPTHYQHNIHNLFRAKNPD